MRRYRGSPRYVLRNRPCRWALILVVLAVISAAYMRTRGHRAEYGMVTLIKDRTGTFHGELQLDDLTVKASATPQGEVTSEPDPFTQVFFEPGETVERVVVLAGRNARKRDCTAEWSTKGDHPLSRGVFVGPT